MENFVYLKEVIDILEKFLAQFGGKAIPSTQEEVDAIESKIRHPYHLPAAFKEYLFYGGHSMGELSRGMRFDYRVTEDITRSDLMKHLGGDGLYHRDFQKAAALAGLDEDSYLEELSGWKLCQVGSSDDQTRFFPPQTQHK